MRRIVVAAAMLAGLAASAAAQGTIRVAVGTTLNQLDLAKTTLGRRVHLCASCLQWSDPHRPRFDR